MSQLGYLPPNGIPRLHVQAPLSTPPNSDSSALYKSRLAATLLFHPPPSLAPTSSPQSTHQPAPALLMARTSAFNPSLLSLKSRFSILMRTTFQSKLHASLPVARPRASSSQQRRRPRRLLAPQLVVSRSPIASGLELSLSARFAVTRRALVSLILAITYVYP